MKILITGGCGFLGSNLAACALARGDELVVFDNLYGNGARPNLAWLQKKGDFKFVHGDIRNNNDVAGLVRQFKPDGIFHLAGQVAMMTSIANPQMDFEVNVCGSLYLLEAVRKYCPEAVLVYSSSNKVYGDLEAFSYCENESRYICNEKPEGFDEATPLNFHSPYGCSKGAADQYMLDYARIFNLRTIVFRHSSMYGGRQYATNEQGWIGWFCEKAVEAQSQQAAALFTISGTGKQVRDVAHADDITRLYFAAFEHYEEAAGEAFNIGGGKENSLSLLELLGLLESLTNTKLRYKRLPARESDQKVFVANIAKAQRYFGWRPQVDKLAGITKLLAWILSDKSN